MSEQGAISKRRGKWSDPGVPHKGWDCVDEDDLGEPSETCEMCETMEIRFVHVMRHPDYPHDLRCGCICAAHMSGDYVGAKSREKEMKKRAGRKKRFLSREWKTSAKGNPHIKVDHYHVTVFPRGRQWKFSVTPPVRYNGPPYFTPIPSDTLFSERGFDTENEAKLAAFDLVMRLKSDRTPT